MPQIKVPQLSEKEKKTLDKKMEALKPKISKAKQQYEELVSLYAELLDQRHPEQQEEQVKETLFRAYLKSERTLEEILAFMEGYDEDDFLAFHSI